MAKTQSGYICDHCGEEIKSGDGVAYIPSSSKSNVGRMYHDSIFDRTSIEDCVSQSFEIEGAPNDRKELDGGTTLIYFWGHFYKMGTIWRKQKKLKTDPDFEKGTRFLDTIPNKFRLWRYLKIRERGIK